ncbi:MAG: hypothetical protein JOZ44_05590 [Acidobacteria bacterium]|nr:hypothetical protein [Acidobacteriota bacterium]
MRIGRDESNAMKLWQHPAFWALVGFLVVADATIAYFTAIGEMKGRLLAVPGILMFATAYCIIRGISRTAK